MGVLPHVSGVGSRAGYIPTVRRDFPVPCRVRRANEPSMAVKATNKSKRTGYNNPAGKSKLLALALLCFTVLLLLASCGEEQPTRRVDTPIPEVPTETPSPTPTTAVAPSPTLMPTPIKDPTPAATEVVRSAATEAPIAEADGGDRIRVAVQQVFDNWNRAVRDDDATLFHSILTRELAGNCALDELQAWLDQGDEFFAEAMVTTVFLDVTDPTRALAELAIAQRAGRPEAPLPYPWPVALEDGEWRSGFPAGLTARSCPYIVSDPRSGPEGREREFPQIPGLDLERRDDILAAVPGTRVLHGSFRTSNFGSSFNSGGSMSPYDNNVNIYAELQTELAAADLARLYRDGLNHPSWEIIDEGSSGDIGWFSWTVLDAEGRLWQGRLAVVPSHEGWKQVWLSLYSNDVDDSQ